MKLLRSVPITDVNLADSSVAETDHAAWAIGTTYASGVRVIKGHRVWLSLAGGNVAHDPVADAGVHWFDEGPTNRWAMFDGLRNTRTVATGSIEIEITPGRVSTLAVVDTDARSVTVEMTVGGVVVYSRTQSLNSGGTAITNWWLYWNEPIGRRTAVIFEDLPLYPTATIAVTIAAGAEDAPVSAGVFVVGRPRSLGITETGVELELNDFSKITFDEFGDLEEVIRRGFSDNVRLRVKIPAGGTEAIRAVLKQYRGVPVLWYDETGIESLIVFGFFRSAITTLDLRTLSYLRLEIAGLNQS